MWTIITNCGKQLSIHSKVREKNDDHYKEYNIIEVEYDQFKLELIPTNGQPPQEKLHQVLSCEQLLQYHFEVEEYLT